MDPTNPLSHDTWTAVGPAPIVSGGTGPDRRPGRRSVRPVGQHRLRRRRQRRHLEDDQLPDHRPERPDLHPADRLRPDQRASTSAASPSSAATTTPTSRSSSPPPARATRARRGVGFLRSMDGGATWNLLDSTNNVDASGNLLPYQLAAPRPGVRRLHRVQGRRRPQADPQRPGDHLRRPERQQRRHLAERRHRQHLAADACRPGHRHGPRPGQRHRVRPTATSRSSTPPSAATASTSARTRARSGTR